MCIDRLNNALKPRDYYHERSRNNRKQTNQGISETHPGRKRRLTVRRLCCPLSLHKKSGKRIVLFQLLHLFARFCRRFPPLLNPKLDISVLVFLLLFVRDDPERLDLDFLKSQERHQRSPQHLQDLVAIVHLLLDDSVRRAEGTHAHLFCQRLPGLHHSIHR